MTDAPRITLRIDRIVTYGAALDAKALEIALRHALAERHAAHGLASWPASRNVAGGRATVEGGPEPLAVRVAQAVVGATGRTPR